MKSRRLEKIVSVLPHCKVLADVGCDHGYVGCEALKRGLAEQVIFIDISLPSLEKARANCPEELVTRAQFVCRDGLGNIRCDAAVIAGMGGLETISVLNSAESLPETLVLQPMRNVESVRIMLAENYEIVSDEVFADGKFYNLILAKKCKNGCKLTADEIAFGKSNLQNKSADFVAYLEKQKRKYNQIVKQCNSAEAVGKLADINRILAKVKEEKK